MTCNSVLFLIVFIPVRIASTFFFVLVSFELLVTIEILREKLSKMEFFEFSPVDNLLTFCYP
jgi:hypothetical protein